MTDETVEEVRRRFDQRAASYDDSTMHRGLAERVAGFAELEGVTAVLDVATGTGLVLRALRARDDARGVRLVGLDVSPGMLAVARQALPDAELLEADATVLPLPGASIDLVTCVTGLQMFPDPDAAVREWARVLRPGGRVVTATFAEFDPAEHRGGAVDQFRRHDRFRTPELLQAALEPGGFVHRRHERWMHGGDVVLIAEAEARG